MQYKELVDLYEKLDNTSKRLEKTYYVSQLIKKTKLEDLPAIILLVQGKIYPESNDTKIGVSSKLVIKAINKSTGTSEKQIEETWKKVGDLGDVAKTLLGKKQQTSLFEKDLSVNDVLKSMRRLSDKQGIGSVDLKLSLISDMLINSTPEESKYIVRTLVDNLRIGLGRSSLRDAIIWAYFSDDLGINYNFEKNDIELNEESRGKYNLVVEKVQHAYDLTNNLGKVATSLKKSGLKGIKELKIETGNPVNAMLYPKAKDIKDAFEIVGKPAAFEFKYDGFRCITGFTSLFIKTKGFMAIRDIKKGDYVLTHKGDFKEIIAKNKRIIDKKERLFEIITYYGSSIKITEKHHILIYKNKQQWVEVEKLKKGDKLVFPLPQIKKKQPFKKILNLSNTSGYSKKIPINDFFFRFLGYWIGDGYTNTYHNTERIGLIFNAKTGKKLAEYYEKNISKNFKIKKISRNIHNGAIYLYWRDRPLREWISTHFRREWKGKTLPEWFLGINKKQFDYFLQGWIDSDGHIDSNGRTSITTKEKDLAMLACLLGLKFKKMIGIKKLRINNKEYHKLIIPKSKRGYSFKKNYVLIDFYSIKELKKRDPRTIVYNLQVKDDESYCSSMITFHNCQIHKTKTDIKLFTRNLENVTEQFPELKEATLNNVKAENCILDGEAVGYDSKTGKYLPFQVISQRIKRKYDIEKIAEKYPVELNVFDIISLENKSMLKESFEKRRNILEKLINSVPKKIVLAKQLITDDEKKAQEFYDEALKQGEEGVMVKSLAGIYKPGARVGYGVKLKSIMEPLDLVIVAAEYGKGKRFGNLSSFYLACNDHGELKEIGKVSTGLKDLEEQGVSFKEITELLKSFIIKTEGKFVKLKPEIVIEVGYEEIQKSINYSSGYALRFPRFLRLRTDEKTVDDINTIEDVENLFKIQRGR